MKRTLKTVIIGAGGVTSYMLPALKNSFDLQVAIFDGDKLEKKNLDRQLFRNNHIGMYKAEALIKQYTFRKNDAVAINAYFTPDLLDTEYANFFNSADVIICAVDNHPARKAAIDAADRFRTPIVVCANEYHTSQAFYYDPELKDTYDIDPLLRYPSIATDTSGSPISCQGLALESTPQLAIANQLAASFGNFLLWNWMGMGTDEETINYTPIEFQSTFSKLQTITLGDVKKAI